MTEESGRSPFNESVAQRLTVTDHKGDLPLGW
jgi:hypothetical protein